MFYQVDNLRFSVVKHNMLHVRTMNTDQYIRALAAVNQSICIMTQNLYLIWRIGQPGRLRS